MCVDVDRCVYMMVSLYYSLLSVPKPISLSLSLWHTYTYTYIKVDSSMVIVNGISDLFGVWQKLVSSRKTQIPAFVLLECITKHISMVHRPTHTSTFIHTHIYTHIYLHTHTHLPSFTHTPTHTSTFTHTHTLSLIHIWRCRRRG